MLQSGELREVLERAEAIQRHGEAHASESDLQAIVDAAAEAGLSPEAVLQALRERVGVLHEKPREGDKVFARSTDGHFYLAHVIGVSPTSTLVRFAKGGDASVAFDGIKPAQLLPGQKVVCPWPAWGWWTCTVLQYDPRTELLKATDNWGSEEYFPLSEVRLSAPKAARTPLKMRQKIALYLITAAVSGGAIGSLITWLLTR